MTALLSQAFRALGMNPSRLSETVAVAAALRASGDRETLAMFEGDTAMERLEAVATEAGSCGLVALDLLTEVVNPGAHERALARGRLGSDQPDPRTEEHVMTEDDRAPDRARMMRFPWKPAARQTTAEPDQEPPARTYPRQRRRGYGPLDEPPTDTEEQL